MRKSSKQGESARLKDSPKSMVEAKKTAFESDDEDWHEAAREYGIEIILHRIATDLDLRKRVRKLLAELPADAPGKRGGIPKKFVIKAVDFLVSRGASKEEAFRRLSHEGATAEAIRRRYYRSKKRSEK
jgi:hypothetical protein